MVPFSRLVATSSGLDLNGLIRVSFKLCLLLQLLFEFLDKYLTHEIQQQIPKLHILLIFIWLKPLRTHVFWFFELRTYFRVVLAEKTFSKVNPSKRQKRSTNQKIGFKAEKVNPAIQGEICLRWKEKFHLYAMMAINNLMDTIKISDKFGQDYTNHRQV